MRVSGHVLGRACLPLVALSLTATGCDSAPEPATPLNEGLAWVLSVVPDDIDPSQREILDEIAATGEVTFEQYRAAVEETLQCAREVGLIIDGPWSVTERGLPALGWGWGSPDGLSGDQIVTLGEDCHQRFSSYVEMAYSAQPSAVDAEQAFLESKRPLLIECLNKYGVETAPGSSMDELLQAMVDLYLSNDSSGPDCGEEIGLVF